MKTIRAIDLGYGRTKFVVSRRPDAPPQCRMFPSIAAASRPVRSSGDVEQRDTTLVDVNGHSYEVGPDVDLALGAHYTQPLHREFTQDPAYLALLRGALHRMGESQIDLLVLGLPVSLLATHSTKLSALAEGRHRMPNGNTVTVRRAWILPQPMGALFDYGAHLQRFRDLRNQTYLVLDLGYFTFDWLVTRGIRVNEQQSGSFPGGMSQIIKIILREISAENGTECADTALIDRALSGDPVRFHGVPLDIERYITRCEPVIADNMRAVMSSVGSIHGIDNVILAGGGAHLFHRSLKRQFPTMAVHIAPDPVFANVRGFQYAGEHRVRAETARLAALPQGIAV